MQIKIETKYLFSDVVELNKHMPSMRLRKYAIIALSGFMISMGLWAEFIRHEPDIAQVIFLWSVAVALLGVFSHYLGALGGWLRGNNNVVTLQISEEAIVRSEPGLSQEFSWEAVSRLIKTDKLIALQRGKSTYYFLIPRRVLTSEQSQALEAILAVKFP